MTLGAFVKRRFTDLKLTEEELADKASISQSYISLIIGGKRRPTPETLHALARALEVEYAALATAAGYIETPSGDVLIPESASDAHWTRRFTALPSQMKEWAIRAAESAIEYRPKPDDGERHDEAGDRGDHKQ